MRDAPAHGSRRGSGSGWAPDSAGSAHGPLEHVKPPASLTNRSLLQRMTRPCPVATLPSAYGRRLPASCSPALDRGPPAGSDRLAAGALHRTARIEQDSPASGTNPSRRQQPRPLGPG